MKTLKTLFALLTLGVLMSPPSLAQVMEAADKPVLQEELVVSGKVDVALDSEKLVRLKTDYGAEIYVPMSLLKLWDDELVSHEGIAPDANVSARMPPGLIGLEPAQNSQVWVTVDGKKFVRMFADDFNDDLFDDNRNRVKLEDGRVVDVSMDELLENIYRRSELLNR